MKNKSYASVMSSTQANKQGIKQETNKKKNNNLYMQLQLNAKRII